MPDLKSISKDAIPGALEKARHYRLLNQPWQTESICRDILKTDPDNQQVIYTLILAMTDQFLDKGKKKLSKVLELVSQLNEEYERQYISGLIYERQAIAAINRKTPRASYISYEYITRAMDFYEKAENVRPKGNEESTLRWNACLRFINHHNLKAAPETEEGISFLDV